MVADRAAALCREHDLFHNDGVHIATCLTEHITFLLTMDGEGKKKRSSPAKMLALNGALATRSGMLAILTPTDFDAKLNVDKAPLWHLPPPAPPPSA